MVDNKAFVGIRHSLQTPCSRSTLCRPTKQLSVPYQVASAQLAQDTCTSLHSCESSIPSPHFLRIFWSPRWTLGLRFAERKPQKSARQTARQWRFFQRHSSHCSATYRRRLAAPAAHKAEFPASGSEFCPICPFYNENQTAGPRWSMHAINHEVLLHDKLLVKPLAELRNEEVESGKRLGAPPKQVCSTHWRRGS